MTGSDHRPVSQVFYLKVNSAMYGPSSIGDLIPMRLRLSDVSPPAHQTHTFLLNHQHRA